MLYPRRLTPLLEAACLDTPVVLVNGARQTGKTTLVQELREETSPRTYLTLDDSVTLATARADPQGFVQNLPERVVLDEVQHCPELFRAIKLQVDRNRAPGRFVLTGSANILLLPKLSESLAGRIEILTLWPLAQVELAGEKSHGIVDALFGESLVTRTLPATPRAELIQRILRGGYPEPLLRASEARRRQWFSSYVTTILQRDIRDLANIEGLTSLPSLLGLLAARPSSLLNITQLASALSMPYATVYRYLSLLEATFLVERLPAWSGNLGARLVKTPKVLLTDTGLACHLLELSEKRLEQDGALLGGLLESFVAMELKKQATWSERQPSLYHWRTQARQEVDIALETRSGEVVGIEVKAAGSVNLADFRGLRTMQESLGSRFVRGVLFYSGENLLPFGEGLFAVPLSMLWS